MTAAKSFSGHMSQYLCQYIVNVNVAFLYLLLPLISPHLRMCLTAKLLTAKLM